MMCKGDRLRALQMRIAWHDRLCMFSGKIQNDCQKLFDPCFDLLRFIPQIHPQIQCHLIIPGTCRMQLLSCISDPGSQYFFYKHVDIFCILINNKCPALQII